MTNNKTQQQKRTVISHWLSAKGQAGQSLIEIMIALAIGAILIGTASLSIAFVLRSSTANQKLQSASGLTRDLVERARSVSSADWQNVYGLTKGTSTAYFINASGTELIILEGKEGVLGDDISSGLVGHWKFDEATSTASTTTYDASGNSNNGTLVGGTSRATSTCQVSHCLDFDGVNDGVDVGDPSSGVLDFGSNDFTLSAWVYSANVSGWAWILAKDNSAVDTTGWRFGINAANPGRLIFRDRLTPQNDTIGNTSLGLNQWYYVAAVRSGTTMMVYLNGVTDGSGTVDGSFDDSNNFRVGRSDFSVDMWQGLIDDVRVYNRALSADEINRLYGSTVFTRYLNLENVNRDSSGNIVASGGDDDPSTQKITTYVEWPGAGSAVGQVKIVDYITRWSNRVFNQTDWSGGSGEEGPLTNPGSKYSSATGVSNPVGSIKIEGL
ncbi:MAG: prepilin-type N-terminal cleavage/methylation domain-containing protein [Patescibacteria group bacterium]|nr:prepilin-type N-terminal cleavage/methylation domain-containing protein [Patescibacteria group bacterium]